MTGRVFDLNVPAPEGSSWFPRTLGTSEPASKGHEETSPIMSRVFPASSRAVLLTTHNMGRARLSVSPCTDMETEVGPKNQGDPPYSEPVGELNAKD